MKYLKIKSACLFLVFVMVLMISCSGTKNMAGQRQYEASLNETIEAVNEAINYAGLNLKGSVNREDGSILITAVELTNQYGSEEPVQTMSIDIVIDKIDDKTVMVEVETPNRKTYVMAGNNQTAKSKFRERIFSSLEKSIGSIKSES